MDPQITMPPYFDFPSSPSDADDARSPLGPQNPYMTYPSPVSPPSQFLGQSPVRTPMASHHSFSGEHTTTVLSLSTVFHPTAHAVEPDLTFMSSDTVLFYIHSQVLKSASPRAFRRVFKAHRDRGKDSTPGDIQQAAGNPVCSDELIHVPDTSTVLNIILHLLYGTSPAQHSPSFEIITTAVDRMPYYDLVPKNFIAPQSPLYDLLLIHAPVIPLQLYTLAAHHSLEELAVATSSHLLPYSLTNLSEDIAERMGAIYLKRLLCLHLERFNALKRILLSPPHPHPATKECSFIDQKKLTRAWAFVSAHLAWDARPGTWSPWLTSHLSYAAFLFAFYFSDPMLMRADLSTHSMRSAFQPLTEDWDCNLCKEGLQKRIRDVVVQWASVKRTI